MKQTKQRILAAALELFNEQGVADTTLRNIARRLEMSQGNLNYHFRLKEDIVEALYFELAAKMDEGMQQVGESTSLLGLLFDSYRRVMEGMYEYRFLLRDFYKVMREQEVIRQHYRQLQAKREKEFLLIVSALRQRGILRKEAFPEEYRRFFQRMNILGDNWINTLETLDPATTPTIDHYAALLFESIFPYLTEAGRAEYALLDLSPAG